MSGETAVNIFGQSYLVKGDDPRRIRAVADYLDERMKELFAGKPGGLTIRGAVMAALNMSDELFRAREEVEQLRQEVEERAQALLKLLD
ncbi:MAG: hypothetical protein A2V67_05505 [Deltaproteobacteria bacterium RBG_13_61_14]|nr:MAG: hypothetical protein A2V67_05505 [Deltaproteobacteria bacterium RBG_13_61_14]